VGNTAASFTSSSLISTFQSVESAGRSWQTATSSGVKRVPKKTSIEVVYTALRDGPKFPPQIPLPPNLKKFNNWWTRHQLARSIKEHPVGKRRYYAYTHPDHAGKKLKWRYHGQTYSDVFQLRPDSPEKQELTSWLQDEVTRVLREKGALFSEEVFQEIYKDNTDLSWDSLRNAISRMKRRAQIIRWDKTRGGWLFEKGYLYALPDRIDDFEVRLSQLDPILLTPQEQRFLIHVRGAIWLLRDLQTEACVDGNVINYYTRKLGREAPFIAEKAGTGNQYRIEVKEDTTKQLKGRGLIKWLRWINLFGNLVIYDEENVPRNEVEKFLKQVGYWLTDEGRRRNIVGEEWEKYCRKFFECRIGPKELAIRLYVVFESKGGLVKSQDVDDFYQALVNEPTFRNWQTGGLRANVIPIILGGKTAEKIAFKKAGRLGVKIVLHTGMEDVIARLTGKRETFYKILKRKNYET